jgi:hypothetical protein
MRYVPPFDALPDSPPTQSAIHVIKQQPVTLYCLQIHVDDSLRLVVWGPSLAILFASASDLDHFISCLRCVTITTADLHCHPAAALLPAPCGGRAVPESGYSSEEEWRAQTQKVPVGTPRASIIHATAPFACEAACGAHLGTPKKQSTRMPASAMLTPVTAFAATNS